jgi:hypothetical protein
VSEVKLSEVVSGTHLRVLGPDGGLSRHLHCGQVHNVTAVRHSLHALAALLLDGRSCYGRKALLLLLLRAVCLFDLRCTHLL